MAARVSAVSRTAEAPASHRQRLPVGRVLEAVVSPDIATEVCPTFTTRFLDIPGLVLAFEIPER
jgi:hypothetical protein